MRRSQLAVPPSRGAATASMWPPSRALHQVATGSTASQSCLVLEQQSHPRHPESASSQEAFWSGVRRRGGGQRLTQLMGPAQCCT